jgi:hypothetical protein
MNHYFESFARKLAQDAIKRTGELIIEVYNEQNPLLKPALEELKNGTRLYPDSEQKKSQKERVIRDNLAAKIPGSKIEVPTLTGRVDILTPSQIIEVKTVRKYKHAIGQVSSYSHYYPKHEKCIYLFGQVSKKQRQLIMQECHNNNITVVFI